jgi:hypothetical protein
MKNRYLITASIIMIFVGILRGIGGILLILNGNNVNAGQAISASKSEAQLLGIGLIVVFLLFLVAAFLIFNRKNRIGLIISWIAVAAFLSGGIINGFVLFSKPIVQGQIFNLIAALIIAVNLILGKVSINKNQIN